jgi:hypothetical protein
MRSGLSLEQQGCGPYFLNSISAEAGMGFIGAGSAAKSLTHAHVLRSLVRIVEGLPITPRDIAAVETARHLLSDSLIATPDVSQYERWSSNDGQRTERSSPLGPPDQINAVLATLANVHLTPDASPDARAALAPIREFFRSCLLKDTQASNNAREREGEAWLMMPSR